MRSLMACLHQTVGVNLPASHLARSAQGASPFGLAQRARSLRAVRSLFEGLQIEVFPKVFADFAKKLLTKNLWNATDEHSRASSEIRNTQTP